DVLVLDMAECRRAQSQRRASQLGIRDDLYPEDVGESGSTVAAKGAEDEILAFLVKDQYSAEHGACLCDLAELPGVKEVGRTTNIEMHAAVHRSSPICLGRFTSTPSRLSLPSTPLRPP